MIPMTCVRAVPYKGRNLNPGENFKAQNELDAHVLITMGKAKRAKPHIAASTREVVASKAAPKKTPRGPKAPRTQQNTGNYRRRDMTADE